MRGPARNLRCAAAPGNAMLPERRTGLPTDSVANVSQFVSIDRKTLGGDPVRAWAVS